MATSPVFSALALAVTLALAPTAFATTLTDASSDPVSGELIYELVDASRGNTINVESGSIKIDNSKNTDTEQPAIWVTNGSHINLRM